MRSTTPWWGKGVPGGAGRAPIAVDLGARADGHTVSVGGVVVRYWDYAPVEWTPQTRTIVMVHGFRGDHHGLERVVELLPHMRIVMPDLPGFGQSPAFPDAAHDIAGYGRFLGDFLDALALGRDTVLLGHSFGSIVAGHFAAAHPGRVFPLILVNPIAAPALEGPAGVLTKLAVFYYRVAARLPAGPGNALLRNPLIVQAMSVAMAKTRDPALRAFIHGQHHAYFSSFADRDMLLESFRASVAGTVRQVAEQLTLPTLLIAGAEDEIATLPSQHKLMELLPRGELVVIGDVGHLIHYETPQPAAAAILDFLERHPPL
ncbi:alpha/beta fold hydrolase [Specibacter sp. RAF43]|uniref:alpha/beta fold hydrolase n=1 Tax=Specibacter sp. RAF43 TaxID=3233057 RepID=UPI003F9C4842